MNLIVFVPSWLFLILIIVTFSSCKKSDINDLPSAYNKVKLFDDSMAHPNTGLTRIASGDNRLFMTYGTNSPYSQIINPADYACKFIVADNEGKLIKQSSLPQGMSISDLHSLDDGSFLIGAAYTYFASPYYLLHFNNDGELISNDSLVVPNLGLNLGSAHLLVLPNGNLLFYGPGDNNNGFIAECDFSGNILWGRNTYDMLYNGIISGDGGYLFITIAPDSTVLNKFDVGLLKTNNAGDEIWTKRFDVINEPFPWKITAAPDGNYRLYFNRYISWPTTELIPLDIYEVNANGDSLNAHAISVMNQNWLGGLITENDGSSFIIVNSAFANMYGGWGSLSNQVNSHFIKFDAGLNIIESGVFQMQSSDLMAAACKTSDGKKACFGIIQSVNKAYYNPGLIIIN